MTGMAALFGTDGIRGPAGSFPLNREAVFSLGESLAVLLRSKGLVPRVLIGRDTRQSGTWLEAALAGGISRSGGSWASAGVIPTGAVSILVRRQGFSAGVIISASHNPFSDNGFKIFSSQGLKIPEDWEETLEHDILAGLDRTASLPDSVEVEEDPALAVEYLDFIISRVQLRKHGRRPRLILDCANGAAFRLAPRLFLELGFETEALACHPNGLNINEACGSQHPQRLARAVQDKKADMGIAFDGDADRAIWVDEGGRVLNGDHTLFIQARHLLEAGSLKGKVVVATSMSNMGLEMALGRLGVKLERTRVGDKYVLERMTELGAVLGGERSGHTIFLEDSPAGDGLLTSLKMLEVMSEGEAPLSVLTQGFIEYPQELKNIQVSRKPDFRDVPELWSVIEEVQAELAGRGRLDVRYSGTEPLARVMAEAEDQALVERSVRRVAEAIARYLGT
jgi:phosphoglucosamine mutase